MCLLMLLPLFWSTPAGAGQWEALISQGDALYAQRGDPAKAKDAVESYRLALRAEPDSEAAAWKLMRALYYLGRISPEEKREAIYGQAVEVGEKALKAHPDSVPLHFWLSVLYGMYGNVKGVMSSLSLVNPIKDLAQWVIDHDPTYEQGGAYRVLGRLYFKLPGLFGGDNDKAIELLTKAVKLGPRHYNAHLFLAEVYLDEGRRDEAKKLLEQVLKGAPDPELVPEDRLWKDEARRMLSQMSASD